MRGKQKAFVVSALIVLILVLLNWLTSDRSQFGSLREFASRADAACTSYFGAINEFALSSGQGDSLMELENALTSLIGALSDVNTAAAIEDTEYAHPIHSELVSLLVNSDEQSDEEVETFLKSTVKTECRKWKSFLELDNSQIENYFGATSQSLTTMESEYCAAVRSEALKVDVAVSSVLTKCSVDFNQVGPTLIIEVSDWLTWVDYSDPPVGDEIMEYLFAIPVGLVVDSFRTLGVDADGFENVLIVFDDDENTIYNFPSGLISEALDGDRDRDEAVRFLQESYFSSASAGNNSE